MDRWYFAYGSNLLSAQMVARTGPIRTGEERPRKARLANYRVAFNMSGGDGELYANIVEPGEGVLGVVYFCSEAALKKLDGFEGGYDHQEVVVVDEEGRELEAIVYVARPERIAPEGRPSGAYLLKIVTGAREHGLPEPYILGLEKIASR